MNFDESAQQRYARQLALPEIGAAGQAKLAAARLLLVGVGGLGSPAGFYLAAAGIGTLGLADGDRLDLSNLQRQIAHTTADVGRLKVESAARTFQALNPAVQIRQHAERLTEVNAGALLRDYDFVIDATDNFESKYLIAAACHAADKPYSHAGILRFFGQTLTVLPGQTACYRCVFADPPPPPTPAVGPLGVVPGVIGTIQAAEAIKFVTGAGKLLTNRLLTFDALTMQFREIAVRRNAACPLCGKIS
ncbi:MAG: HesA/MoeB/ThiF family protein [Verrucomicrobia bacterium]|nr:MAG: HesA/MoeB/ThiF family protein [Verrucomicrobiota bacterium]